MLLFVSCRLFVVLKTRIQVFSFPKDPKLLFYFDTKENLKGVLIFIIFNIQWNPDFSNLQGKRKSVQEIEGKIAAVFD